MTLRNPNLADPREARISAELDKLIQYFDESCTLQIETECEGSCCYPDRRIIVMDLQQADKLAKGTDGLSIETVEIFILAHEYTHLLHHHLLSRSTAPMRKREGNADLVAGFWTTIRIGQGAKLDPPTLAEVAIQLQGGRNLDEYPNDYERANCVAIGLSQAAWLLSAGELKPPTIREERVEFLKELWNMSTRKLN